MQSNKESGMKLKIGYFADGVWSHNAFDKLIKDKDIEIKFICARYDSNDEKLLNYSKEFNIDYLKHNDINSDEFIGKIKHYNCDLFVSMSFNQIFKSRIINLPRYKTINCHAGKLPFYRGRNILNWALINDEKEFGITVHYMDTGIDTGDIILQKCFTITDNDDYKSILTKAHSECANILYEAICLFKNGKAESKKQEGIGFYCSRRIEGDENLNFNQTSREVFNFVRAICYPAIVARAFLNDKEMKINKVELVKDAPQYKCVPGAILCKDGDTFLVKTQDSFVKVVEYEYDGKIKVGDRFDVK